MSGPPEFKMSLNARCLAEGYGDRFKKLPRHPLELHRDPFHPEGTKRDFVKVTVRGEVYWADYVTGSLYEPKTGQCLSGSGRVKV